MDNPTFPPPDRRPQARFAPDRRYTAAAGAGFLIALGTAVFTSDQDGRLLAAVAAVMLAVAAVSDLVFSPRLEGSVDGVVIRSPFTRVVLRWDEIDSIEVVSRMRLGLRNSALEIDAGAVLAEFSRRSISAAPDEARDLLLSFRPR